MSSHTSTYYEENQLYYDEPEPFISPIQSSTRNASKRLAIPPVEIHEECATSIDLPPISWHGYGSVPKILSVINTGRTILLNGQWTKGRPFIKGGPLNGSYIFSQIHFHCPSEHEINGRRFPLEMHVVHYKTSYLTQERAMEEKDGTVVLVYLFKVVDARKTVLSSITELCPRIGKKNGRSEITQIPLDKIIKTFTSNYYIYWGSVSTGKNSYLLQWIISCSNLFVTRQEVHDFIKIMDLGSSINEKPVLQMKLLNDAVFRVGEEDYGTPAAEPKLSREACRHYYSHQEVHLPQISSHTSRRCYRCNCKAEEKKDMHSQTSCHRASCSQTSCQRASCSQTCLRSSSILHNPSHSSACKKEKEHVQTKDPCAVKKVMSCPSVSTLEIFFDGEPGPEDYQCAIETKEDCQSQKKLLRAKTLLNCVKKKLKCEDAKKDEKKSSKCCQQTKVHSKHKSCEQFRDNKTKSNKKSNTDNCKVSKTASKSVARDCKQKEKKKCEKSVEVTTSKCCTGQESKSKVKKRKQTPDCEPSCSKSSTNKNMQTEKKKSKSKIKTDECESISVSFKSSVSEEKETIKKRKSATEVCESVGASSKSSTVCDEKEEGKKKRELCSSYENCDTEPEDQCLIICEKQPERASATKIKTKKSEKSSSKESVLSCCSTILSNITEGEKPEKAPSASGPGTEIKTLFKKIQEYARPKPKSAPDDCTVNFLLVPNSLPNQTSCLLATSESEGLRERKTENEYDNVEVPDVTVNTAIVPEFGLNAFKEKEQFQEFRLQTEHVFRTETNEDFSGCLSQEYNVAIIYKQTILQEFKGTFHPNKLEAGNYEKLNLLPKYPELETISVRLEDCIVKMENSNELYVRAKFLLKRNDFNDIAAGKKNMNLGSVSDLEHLDDKNDHKSISVSTFDVIKTPNSNKNEKLEDFFPLKNELLEEEECKINPLKHESENSGGAGGSMSTISGNQSPVPEEALDQDEKDLPEKCDKELKNLLNKRRKIVYFTYEKVEKDENSGKKIFVGSFRTKDEMRTLSKQKKLLPNTKPLFAIEKSVGNNEKKTIFLLPNKDSDFEELENPTEGQELKIQPSTESSEIRKPNKNDDLITLSKWRPKSVDTKCVKNESKSPSLHGEDVKKRSESFSSKVNEEMSNSETEDTKQRPHKSATKQDSQVAFIIIPVEMNSLSKIDVILVEHPDSVKENDTKKEKEYIPCLNIYDRQFF